MFINLFEKTIHSRKNNYVVYTFINRYMAGNQIGIQAAHSIEKLHKKYVLNLINNIKSNDSLVYRNFIEDKTESPFVWLSVDGHDALESLEKSLININNNKFSLSKIPFSLFKEEKGSVNDSYTAATVIIDVDFQKMRFIKSLYDIASNKFFENDLEKLKEKNSEPIEYSSLMTMPIVLKIKYEHDKENFFCDFIELKENSEPEKLLTLSLQEFIFYAFLQSQRIA